MASEKRTQVTLKFEPDGNERVPARFRLERHTTKQLRRRHGENFYDDSTQPDYHIREVLAVLTRREVSNLIADGVDWLAYGEEDA